MSSRIVRLSKLSMSSTSRTSPIKVYSTSLIWCGARVLNPISKTYREYQPLEVDSMTLRMVDMPYPNQLTRVDYLDPVTVRIYSESVWAENDVLFTCLPELEPRGRLH